ncbi:phenylacetate--CoA ligase family protein [Methanobacterium formicicum]|uniref:Phenylacetate--CoA ligase family protein n=1 Tax=Methanobacterium formicicum TaxID=2162 RepID=A0A843AVP5_METFO|nr:hypothetical protein [Methanobacterium formicicum]MBF4475244.1 phenylacetate--CoA ligase family protein [Methanobacterium formicicum]
MGVSDSITFKALGMFKSYNEFRNTYKLLKKSQNWTKEQLEIYQLEKLNQLLNHAYVNVPYYARIFDERGIKPSDIQSIEDLNLLPILTKEIIKDNINDLKSTSLPENKLEYVTTGGSTGDPMGFYYEKGVSRAQEWAFIKTLWDRVGYRFRDKCVILRGNVVKNHEKGIFWEKSFFNRWLILSSYHLSDENLGMYVEKIREFDPRFIQAYPSAVTILAKYMEKKELEPFENLKAVLCGSENIHIWQRELVERVLGCRVFSWYGHSERAILAGECELSSSYHIFPEYGIFELIDHKGNPTKDEKGIIVSTSLTNYAMPFIRYKTDDVGIILKENKCNCGRNYPLLSTIEGRLQEYIITKNRSVVSLTALIFSQHFYSFSMIKEMQIVQEEVGKIIIKIIPEANYSSENEDEIKSKLKNVVDDLEIDFEYVDHIQRTKTGKHKFLIQKLELDTFGYS